MSLVHSNDIPARIVRANMDIKELKASQILNGDNSITYSYSARASGEVRDYMNNFVFDNDTEGTFIFMSEGLFPLASVSLRTWINGNEITDWGDYVRGNLRPYKKSNTFPSMHVGLVSLRAKVESPSSYPRDLQNPLAIGWRVWVDGYQMAVGTRAEFELSVVTNQKGRLYTYDWAA